MITRKHFIAALALLWGCCSPAWSGEHVVVIGNANVHKIDLDTLQRIYTGKVVEVDGVHVIPVNASTAMPLRQRFFSQYLQTDEDQYVAYWTVRRYVGKGTPPHEVSQKSEMIDFVEHTPGAIGYVDESDVQPGMNVILKR